MESATLGALEITVDLTGSHSLDVQKSTRTHVSATILVTTPDFTFRPPAHPPSRRVLRTILKKCHGHIIEIFLKYYKKQCLTIPDELGLSPGMWFVYQLRKTTSRTQMNHSTGRGGMRQRISMRVAGCGGQNKNDLGLGLRSGKIEAL